MFVAHFSFLFCHREKLKQKNKLTQKTESALPYITFTVCFAVTKLKKEKRIKKTYLLQNVHKCKGKSEGKKENGHDAENLRPENLILVSPFDKHYRLHCQRQ